MSDGTIRLIDGEEPEFLDAIVESMEPCTKAWYQGRLPARPVAVCVDGQIVWTETDPDSPEAALMRYFSGLARQQLATLPLRERPGAARVREMEQTPEGRALLQYGRDFVAKALGKVPAKLPSPHAKPALSGLTKTAAGAYRGLGWCDE